MSKLEELIKEFCPDGVEYKKLGEVATISRGGNFQKKDFLEQGVPCIHYGQIYTRFGLFADNALTFISAETAKRQKMAKKNDIIMAVTSENLEDVGKCLAWFGDEDVAVSGHAAIIHHNLNAKYLVYFLHSSQFYDQKRKIAHGTKVIEITPDKLNNIVLPVPPLPIQHEIVRILDNFTELTAELQAKLTAELTARKKQYKYYRDALLSFEQTKEVQRVKLGDICSVITKGTTPKKYFQQGVSFIKTEAIDGNTLNHEKLMFIDENTHNGPLRRSILQKNDILITIAGATIGKCVIVPESVLPANTNQALGIIRLKPGISCKYVFYILQSTYMKEYMLKSIKGSAQPNLNLEQLNNFSFPLPPFSIQQRIVNVLNNFDAICSDLNIGLPAEIEARQKQYEYYRDLLLSFDNSQFVNVERERERERERVGISRNSEIALLQYVFGYVLVELNEVIHSLNTGLNPRHFFKLNTDDATNYYVTIKEIRNGCIIPTEKTDRINEKALALCNNRSNLEIGDVLFSGTGTIGETAIITESPNNWNIKEGVYAIKPKRDMILTKFLRYLLTASSIRNLYMKKVAGGTVKSIPMGELRKIVIPLPSLKKQKEIVAILDRFDALCNDISEGLHAEIETRQKQYEYYRDKLLSFPIAK